MAETKRPREPFAPWDRRALPGLFDVEETAKRVGHYKWVELKLFEALGGWVAPWQGSRTPKENATVSRVTSAFFAATDPLFGESFAFLGWQMRPIHREGCANVFRFL